MAWYDRAIKMELQPESDAQEAIRPTQLIVHSIVANWTARRTYEYWRDSTTLESHFGIGYAMGDIAQYIGTETRADANYKANRRPDGSGAISVETASNSTATDPWTAHQLAELIRLGAWAHQRHGVPLRICRTHDDPGFGFHSMFPEWSPGGTACPGPARIKQFRDIVFPGIVDRATRREDLEMTPEEHEALMFLRRNLGSINRVGPGQGKTHAAGFFLAVGEAHAHSADRKLDTVLERLEALEGKIAALTRCE